MDFHAENHSLDFKCGPFGQASAWELGFASAAFLAGQIWPDTVFNLQAQMRLTLFMQKLQSLPPLWAKEHCRLILSQNKFYAAN